MELLNSALYTLRRHILDHCHTFKQGDVGNEFHPSHRVASFKRIIELSRHSIIIIHYHSKRKIVSVNYIFDSCVLFQISMHGDGATFDNMQMKFERFENTSMITFGHKLKDVGLMLNSFNDILNSSDFKTILQNKMFYEDLSEKIAFDKDKIIIS